MLTYPSDDVLLARGRYSTLGKERRVQLERAHKIYNTLVHAATQAMRDCEQRPPVSVEPLNVIAKCLENMTKAREALVVIGAEMESLKAEAWDGTDEG